MCHDNEFVNIGPEMNNLRERLEHDEKSLEASRDSGLHTLIYYFERFLEHHKKYEKTRRDLFLLDSKMKKLSEGEHDECY